MILLQGGLMRIAFVALALVAVVVGFAAHAMAATLKPDAAAVAAASVPLPFAEGDGRLKKYVDGKGGVDYNAIDRGAFEKVFAAVAASSPKKNPDRYPSLD